MNKMIIGAVFSICGTLLFSAILIAGAVFGSTMDSWSGSSKLWYAILSKVNPEEGVYTTGLSFLFYFAIALFLVGLTCLLWEQAKKVLKMEI